MKQEGFDFVAKFSDLYGIRDPAVAQCLIYSSTFVVFEDELNSVRTHEGPGVAVVYRPVAEDAVGEHLRDAVVPTHFRLRLGVHLAGNKI